MLLNFCYWLVIGEPKHTTIVLFDTKTYGTNSETYTHKSSIYKSELK